MSRELEIKKQMKELQNELVNLLSEEIKVGDCFMNRWFLNFEIIQIQNARVENNLIRFDVEMCEFGTTYFRDCTTTKQSYEIRSNEKYVKITEEQYSILKSTFKEQANKIHEYATKEFLEKINEFEFVKLDGA